MYRHLFCLFRGCEYFECKVTFTGSYFYLCLLCTIQTTTFHDSVFISFYSFHNDQIYSTSSLWRDIVTVNHSMGSLTPSSTRSINTRFVKISTRDRTRFRDSTLLWTVRSSLRQFYRTDLDSFLHSPLVSPPVPSQPPYLSVTLKTTIEAHSVLWWTPQTHTPRP